MDKCLIVCYNLFMKVHRFYFDGSLENYNLNDKMSLNNKEQVHQIVSVLRLEKGEYISVFNASKELLCEITDIDNSRRNEKMSLIIKDIVYGIEKKMSYMEINLYMSVIKKDKFEMVIEKSVELNISSVTPLITMRTEKSHVSTVKSESEQKRIQKIIIEATEQCGRTELMRYHVEVPLDHMFKEKQTHLKTLNVFAHIDSEESMYEIVSSFKKENLILDIDKKLIINVYIGPEGGWHPEEVEKMKQAGYRPVSIAKYILRAETAAIVALAQI